MSPMPRILRGDTENIYFLTPTVVEWIDVFTKWEYFEILADSLKYCIKNKGLVLYEYVFMTNHIHLIVGVDGGKALQVPDRAAKPAMSGSQQADGSTEPAMSGKGMTDRAAKPAMSGSQQADRSTEPAMSDDIASRPKNKITHTAGSVALSGAGSGLDSVIRDFKSYTTYQMKKLIKTDNRKYIQRLIKNSYSKDKANDFQLWQRENYAVQIVSEKFLDIKINYIWQNPVKKGYVSDPESWFYSSARQKISRVTCKSF
jgi:REP element-mobilizing transposase RayT